MTEKMALLYDENGKQIPIDKDFEQTSDLINDLSGCQTTTEICELVNKLRKNDSKWVVKRDANEVIMQNTDDGKVHTLRILTISVGFMTMNA